MEAIVLAGGLGTRLRGVVGDVPKPMAPVQGRPFLAFLLDQLVGAGFNRTIIAAGYRYEAIRSYFGEDYRGLALSYSVEREPLGTGGAIRLACAQTSARDIFVLNGDTYAELDFNAMLEAHQHGGAQLTMAVCQMPDVSRYGALVVSDGLVRGICEKGQSGPGCINAGVYILGSELAARLPQGAFSFEQDVLTAEMKSIQPRAFPVMGLFVDIGVPDDYTRAQQLFSQRFSP